MATALQRSGSAYVQRSSSGGLYEVIDVILDKGLVIDVFLRVSLVGIELLTVDARIVIASVDTYLRFAEAVNRLELNGSESEGLPQLGQKVAQAAEQAASADLSAILDALEPLAVAIVVGEPEHERVAANASFLVQETQIPAFDAAVNELGAPERRPAELQVHRAAPLCAM